MKRESGTDEPPPSTRAADLAAAIATTAAYLGLLLVGFLLFWSALSAVDLVPRRSPLTAAGPEKNDEILKGLLLYGGLTAWAWACDRWLRRQWSRRGGSWAEIALLGRPLPIVGATLVGGVVVVAGVWLGGARLASQALSFEPRSWLLLTLLLVVAAALEEVALRGLLLAVWLRALGRPAALLLTSTLFAWLHQSNPGANLLGLLNTLLAGWVLGELALRGAGLGAPIALHFAWNWAQGLLLGLPVSGQRASTSVLTLEPGNSLLAGGAYGFEEGLAATLVLCLGVVWTLRGPRVAEPIDALQQGPSPGDE